MCAVMGHPLKAIFLIPELQLAERVSYSCKSCVLATSVPSHAAVCEAQITLRQGGDAWLEQRGAYHDPGNYNLCGELPPQLRTRALRSSSAISRYNSM
jgi:hypothetical protein